MQESDVPQDKQNRRRSDHKRLDSWKAIANYFNRSVRTVRRWEANEDLPVHRHRHSKGFSVYAYPTELAEWQAKQIPVRPSESPTAAAAKTSQQTRGIGGYCAAAILGAAVALLGAKALQQSDDVSIEEANANTKQLMEVMWRGARENGADDIAQAIVFPVISAWNGGNPGEAHAASQQLQAQLPTLPAEARSKVALHLADVSLAMGRVDEVRRLLESIDDKQQKHELEALLMFASGQKGELQAHLVAGTPYSEPISAFLMTVAGLDASQPSISGDAPTDALTAAQRNVIAGISAMRAGRVEEAKPYFENAVAELDAEDQAYYFVGPDMLSRILEAEGDMVGAIAMLEETMPRRYAAAFNRSAVFWMMCQRNLALLYRKAGRESDAVRVESELRQLLQFADDDFPLRQSLYSA